MSEEAREIGTYKCAFCRNEWEAETYRLPERMRHASSWCERCGVLKPAIGMLVKFGAPNRDHHNVRGTSEMTKVLELGAVYKISEIKRRHHGTDVRLEQIKNRSFPLGVFVPIDFMEVSQ